MTIETISYLKQNAASLALDEPMVITQSGKPVYRIENEEYAKLRDEGIALLKLMNLAERDLRKGKTLSTDEAKNKLRQIITSGQVSLNGKR
ncbi:MAG: hypothetical protein ACI9T7_003411 [Oleiphilaceae bacterium]|jgi:hypothetical protein